MTTNKKLTRQLTLVCLCLGVPWYAYALGKPCYKHPTSKQEGIAKTWLFDRYWSPYAAASLLMSTRACLNAVEDQWLLDRAGHSLGVRYTTAVINNLVNDLVMLTAHEVNGHGFRQRSYNKPVAGYGLSPKFKLITPFFTPVNGLGGVAYYTIWYSPETADLELLLAIAGNEANAILAHEILFKNFKVGYLDHRDYNLFFKAFTNLLGYLMVTSPDQPGDDIQTYLHTIQK
ncbi:MAG: hypothetical protein AAF392_02770, partial [Bacteroidota bacterium]